MITCSKLTTEPEPEASEASESLEPELECATSESGGLLASDAPGNLIVVQAANIDLIIFRSINSNGNSALG